MKDTIFLMEKGTWVGMYDVPGMWILNDALKYQKKKKREKKINFKEKVIQFSLVIETPHKQVPHYTREVHLLKTQSPLLPFYLLPLS